MSCQKVMNAISFDVEDWYQVTAFDDVLERKDWHSMEYRLDIGLEKIFTVLKEQEVKATFFVLGNNLKTHPEIAEKIVEQGHDIASHGTNHRLIYDMTPDEFRADLQDSLECTRALVDVPVTGYRAPSFSITERSLWALDILIDNGIEYDSSVVPMKRSLYGIPDADLFPCKLKSPGGREIFEFPITTRTILRRTVPFCGGAYLRLFPLFLLKRWIAELNRRGNPAIIYMHPWELDPGQPALLSKKWSTLHYLNLKSTENKLRALLQEFEFGSVRDALLHHAG